MDLIMEHGRCTEAWPHRMAYSKDRREQHVSTRQHSITMSIIKLCIPVPASA